MQTDKAKNEPSSDKGNRKVMGETELLQADSSSRKPAESLSMTDLQVSSVDQQLQKELKHLSLTEEFEKEDVNSDRWESMLHAVHQSLDRLTSSLAPAITRIEQLEEQQNAFSNRSRANTFFQSDQDGTISATTTAPIVTEQIGGVTISLSSTEHSQSVVLSTTSAAEVAVVTDYDFEFPKVTERDKYFDIVTRVKSTPAPGTMYLCSPLTPRCRAAKTYQKFQEPGCQNRSRHFFKFSKKFPRGQNSRLLESIFQ